jgi:hypothetical protein
MIFCHLLTQRKILVFLKPYLCISVVNPDFTASGRAPDDTVKPDDEPCCHENTFHYTTPEETEEIGVFREKYMDEEGRKHDIEKINERIGKDYSVIPDVALVGLQEEKSEYEVK